MTKHNHPRPYLRRAATRLIAVGLIGALIGIIAQMILGMILAPLFFGTAFFTAVLMIPLLMQSVLYPEITVLEEGLRLKPMLWEAATLPWSAIREIVPHPLIYNDEVVGQHLHGKKYRPREGVIVIIRRVPGLSPLYLLVGMIAEQWGMHAFAISSTTHTEYQKLVQEIQNQLALTNE